MHLLTARRLALRVAAGGPCVVVDEFKEPHGSGRRLVLCTGLLSVGVLFGDDRIAHSRVFHVSAGDLGIGCPFAFAGARILLHAELLQFAFALVLCRDSALSPARAHTLQCFGADTQKQRLHCHVGTDSHGQGNRTDGENHSDHQQKHHAVGVRVDRIHLVGLQQGS